MCFIGVGVIVVVVVWMLGMLIGLVVYGVKCLFGSLCLKVDGVLCIE